MTITLHRRRLGLALLAALGALMLLVVSGDATTVVHASPTATLPAGATRFDCSAAGAAFIAGLGEESEEGSDLSPAEADAVVRVLKACWAALQPGMDAAKQSCDHYRANPGIRDDVGLWRGTVQRTGQDEALAGESGQIDPWQIRSLLNCHREAFEKCVERPDVTQAADMLKVERELALLGADAQVDRSRHEKCQRFELAIDSRLTVAYTTGHVYRSHVRATMPVRLGENLKLTGEGPLEIVSYALVESPIYGACRQFIESYRAAEPVRIFSFQIDLEALLGHEADLALSLPERPLEMALELLVLNTFTSVEKFGCGEATPTPTVSGGEWDDTLWHAHRVADGPPRVGGVISIKDWRYVGGRVIARKVTDRSVVLEGEQTVTESTTYELRHTPIR